MSMYLQGMDFIEDAIAAAEQRKQAGSEARRRHMEKVQERVQFSQAFIERAQRLNIPTIPIGWISREQQPSGLFGRRTAVVERFNPIGRGWVIRPFYRRGGSDDADTYPIIQLEDGRLLAPRSDHAADTRSGKGFPLGKHLAFYNEPSEGEFVDVIPLGLDLGPYVAEFFSRK